jgi:hypothetical protein
MSRGEKMKIKNIYLILSILGAIIPYVFFAKFIQLNGIQLGGFIEGLFVNGAAGGFSADVLVSSVVFWIYIYQDKELKQKWVLIALNLLVGLSCALPFYFYKKEK